MDWPVGGRWAVGFALKLDIAAATESLLNTRYAQLTLITLYLFCRTSSLIASVSRIRTLSSTNQPGSYLNDDHDEQSYKCIAAAAAAYCLSQR